MDLIILIVVLVLVIYFFRRFESFIYIVGIIDLTLRVLNLIDNNINWPQVNTFINEYLPKSILDIINNHATGVVNLIAVWFYIACLGIFIYYTVKKLLLKRK